MTTLPDTGTATRSPTRSRDVLRRAGGLLAAILAVVLDSQLARIAELVTYAEEVRRLLGVA